MTVADWIVIAFVVIYLGLYIYMPVRWWREYKREVLECPKSEDVFPQK